MITIFCVFWIGLHGSFMVTIFCVFWIGLHGSFMVTIFCVFWIGLHGSFMVTIFCVFWIGLHGSFESKMRFRLSRRRSHERLFLQLVGQERKQLVILLQWKLLNVITLGQTRADNKNWMIAKTIAYKVTYCYV